MPAAATIPQTLITDTAALPEFPDDPRKWNGWSNYQSDNLYDRLCLDARTNPSDRQIQQHYNALLYWWQKKLPLKNQPANPMAQLLGRGLDEASRYLAQAQVQLLDPERRRQLDEQLAAAEQEETLTEFSKYIAFSIKDGALTAEAEANLLEFGQQSGLSDEHIAACIAEAIRQNNARRVPAEPEPLDEEEVFSESDGAEPENEFHRILQLSEVNMGSATESVRRLLTNVAHNLGIDIEIAEDLLDEYLDQEELAICQKKRISLAGRTAPAAAAAAAPPQQPIRIIVPKTQPGRLPPVFVNPVGGSMVPIPAGDFVMGSDAIDAAPNEQPLTPVRLSQFFISKHPVTNAQYEQFDPGHRRKRMPGASDNHPVAYVTGLEAIKFSEWLCAKDGRPYRLPTEAEWEYAARGGDGRKYPWGNHDRRSDLANFADASTTFPWRETRLSDGYPETSPVGAFPRGASPFGIEDMAGNVWEWCLDYLRPLPGTPKHNPRAAGSSGGKQVHRGGSWKSRFSNLRTTARAANAPNYCCNDLGFRIVCETGRAESR